MSNCHAHAKITNIPLAHDDLQLHIKLCTMVRNVLIQNQTMLLLLLFGTHHTGRPLLAQPPMKSP